MMTCKRLLALNLALLLAFLLAIPALAASSISLGQSASIYTDSYKHHRGDPVSFTPKTDGVYRAVITENGPATPSSLSLFDSEPEARYLSTKGCMTSISVGAANDFVLGLLKGGHTYYYCADKVDVGSATTTFHVEPFYDTVSIPYRGSLNKETLYVVPPEDGYYDFTLLLPGDIDLQGGRLDIITESSSSDAAKAPTPAERVVGAKSGELEQTDQGGYVREYTKWLSRDNLYAVSIARSYLSGWGAGSSRVPFTIKDTDKFTLTIKPSNVDPSLVMPNLDGGTWSGTLVLNDDGTLKKPEDPTKPGYIFAGWYLDDGTAWDFSRKVITGLKLNARWLPAVKIILRLDTGDMSVDAGKGAPMNVPVNPTKEGYTFAGWFTDEALSIPWNFNTVVTGEMTLYGKWTPLSSTAAGTGQSSQAITFNGAPIQLEAYTLAADENGGDVTFVKLRDVAQVLDGSEDQFNVEWKNGAIYVSGKSAYTAKNGTELQPIVVNTTAYAQNTSPVLFDGQMKPLESIVITDINGGGHSFFKLRDLAAAIGFTVDWSAERGIYIETQG